MDDWTYLDAQDQPVGPISFSELKRIFQEGIISVDTFVFHEVRSPDNWHQIHEVSNLEAELKVSAGESKKPPPRRQSMARRASLARNCSVSECQSSAFKRGYCVEHLNALAAGGTSWIEKFTADGVPYYFNRSTDAVSWDKPEELKTDEDRVGDNGEWMWVPDAEEAFVPALVVSSRRDGKVDVQLQSGERRVIKAGSPMFPLKLSSLRRLEQDLVLLDSLDEGLILYNLRERYLQDKIYSNIGTILISLNPYKRLPLYTIEKMDEYAHSGNRQLEPHVFSIAEAALRNLTLDHESQSILISGESGAGKTEATKQCLAFIAENAGSTNNIEQRVLQANPILEAFGNAKTLRNDNSSRFGRFTEIHFDPRGSIRGARIENYLLEKSRVVYQQAGERNYHIFYQMCASGNRAFGLSSAENYLYINTSGCMEVDGMDDEEEFSDVLAAMDQLDFSSAEKDWVLSLTSAVLLLGNVTFSPDGDAGCHVADRAALAQVAEFLSVDSSALERSVTFRTFVTRRESMTLPLKPDQARDSADALAKAIYGRLFDWLVSRINQCLVGTRSPEFIGILDIFGFEIFENNSFEQLCINFTNEKLQRLFNEHTFKIEEEIYRSEGVRFEHIEYQDNQPVLELIEKKPNGILVVADDEIKGPKATDKGFVGKIDRRHKANPYFKTSSRTLRSDTCFTIVHYAGAVVYDATGFLAKNKDVLLPDLYDVLSSTRQQATATLFPRMAKETRSKHSLGGQFRRQLTNLMSNLSSTYPHYIRCVKPTPNKLPQDPHSPMILEQLRYSGVFEAVEIRKRGFPFRYTWQRFVERYKCLMIRRGRFIPFTSRAGDWKAMCREILSSTRQDHSDVQFGQTMVLYRSDQHRLLTLLRALALEQIVSKIQGIMRGVLTRKFVRLLQSAKPILTAAIASNDIDQLDAAMAQAADIVGQYGHMFAVELPEMTLARKLRRALEEWVKLAEHLQYVLALDMEDDENFETLFQALQRAESLGGVRTSDYHQQLFDTTLQTFEEWRAYRLEPGFVEALSMIERDQMTAHYAEAKRLRCSDPRLGEIESLMGASEDELLKLQYQKAKELNFVDRATDREVRLKEKHLASHGGMFRFEDFRRIVHPIEYANAPFLCLNRDELAAGMLKFNKNTIPTSLTRLSSPELVKEAVKINKAILGYMGIRKNPDPDALAQEVVSKALATQELRVEVLLQIMKAVTDNPLPQCTTKCWSLLALCLLHFSPGNEFENYLHIFCRTRPPAADRMKYVGAIYARQYEGDCPVSPSVDGVSQQIGEFFRGSTLNKYVDAAQAIGQR